MSYLGEHEFCYSVFLRKWHLHKSYLLLKFWKPFNLRFLKTHPGPSYILAEVCLKREYLLVHYKCSPCIWKHYFNSIGGIINWKGSFMPPLPFRSWLWCVIYFILWLWKLHVFSVAEQIISLNKISHCSLWLAWASMWFRKIHKEHN